MKPQASQRQDTIFKSLGNYPTPFRFNEQVAAVFDDMLVRSIPAYESMLYLCLQTAKSIDGPSQVIYDLGCSTGKLLRLFAIHRVQADCFGIDNSSAMIDQAKHFNLPPHMQLICSDILDHRYKMADMFVLNYVLQFLSLDERLKLLRNICKSLKADAFLFLSEKLRIDPKLHADFIQMEYDSFKETKGYARVEIERKKEALGNVLISSSEDELKSMLVEAGFNQITCVQRNLQFASFIVSK